MAERAGGLVRGRRVRRGPVLAVLVVAVALVAGAGALFEPWRLWTVRTASESAPSLAGGRVASGRFVSLAHATSGSAVLARAGDGRVVLRLEGLSTSDGPDVRVWLSTAGADRAREAEDAAYLDAGELRANRGDLTYLLPEGTDPDRFASVVIWCRRFSVAFGAAGLEQSRG